MKKIIYCALLCTMQINALNTIDTVAPLSGLLIGSAFGSRIPKGISLELYVVLLHGLAISVGIAHTKTPPYTETITLKEFNAIKRTFYKDCIKQVCLWGVGFGGSYVLQKYI